MRSWVYRMCLGLCVLGCSAAEDDRWQDDAETDLASAQEIYRDEITGDEYVMNQNRRVLTTADVETDLNGGDHDIEPGELGSLRQAINSSGTVRDGSGRVEVQIVECNSGAPRTGSISVGCSVGPDYVLIGGGAQDVYSGQGAMLWESRPQDSDDTGQALSWLQRLSMN